MAAWHLAAAFAAGLGLSALLVAATLGYARKRGLLDMPGRRRSHEVPTPRGGGLGLVLAGLPILAWAWGVAVPWLSPVKTAALLLALAALLGVGWLDDRRGLANVPRLLVHLGASIVLAVVVFQGWQSWPPIGLIIAAAGLVLATAWSINLHNFMDGIDALLAVQTVFYFAALGGFAWFLGAPGVALACAGLVGAGMAFLGYNRPPARIFMGDAGSVPLGWLVACLAVLLWHQAPVGLWLGLLLASSFVIDASLTLVGRMRKGRRWYTAHREHAYQWLVRSGWSHGWVVMLYLAWNLVVVLPAALATAAWPRLGPWLLLAVCVCAAGAFGVIRHHCRKVCKRRQRSAA